MMLAIVSGCAKSGPIGGAQGLQLVSSSALPAPTDGDFKTAGRTYYIGPLDKLRIEVFGVEDLTREVQVDSSGRFTFPLVGGIDASGRTLDQVSSQIEAGLRGRYVKNPSATVNLVETQSQIVTVDGQVGKPGLYPVIGRMTLVQAVASAQGTGEFAKTDEVIVFRTVGGARYAGIYNIDAIRRGNYADPEIFANDVIVVGDSPARRQFRTIIQSSGLITTPLIIALQNL